MNPDKVQARKMVLVSMLLLAAIVVYKDRKQGTFDTFRALWGVGVVSMMLSLLADFAPTVAGPFGVLIVLGSLTGGGSQLLAKLVGGAGNLATAPIAAHPAAVPSRTNTTSPVAHTAAGKPLT